MGSMDFPTLTVTINSTSEALNIKSSVTSKQKYIWHFIVHIQTLFKLKAVAYIRGDQDA